MLNCDWLLVIYGWGVGLIPDKKHWEARTEREAAGQASAKEHLLEKQFLLLFS